MGEETGTSKVSLAEGNTRAGLSLATIKADISVAVGDEGQFTQGLGEVDCAVFTVAVVERVGSRDNTVEESIDGLVEGPSTADDIGGSIRICVWIGRVATEVLTVTSDKDSFNTESKGKSSDVGASVGAENVKDGEALSHLGEVDTWAEGSLVGELANTSAAWIASLVTGRRGRR